MPVCIAFGGAGEMLDKLVSTLPPPKNMEAEDEKDKPLAIAIVGRPNVGESSQQTAGWDLPYWVARQQ